ncbi:hypothetical protein M514_03737 [Trichuris suis]|uniref:Uncharacterized protein n=1 Tax=Trichuris suis TaxID=68888 RepID=A0A085NGX7_9BILA|nr:hypothetical protein M514_03737 [Trichuris suis]
MVNNYGPVNPVWSLRVLAIKQEEIVLRRTSDLPEVIPTRSPLCAPVTNSSVDLLGENILMITVGSK